MSDADDSDFDKEAERERLREKYDRDKEDRAAAEQMSDLLLKGATMTNAHCGECGSPIFRHDGQEFCPNCSAQAAAGEAGSGDGSPATAGGQTAQEQPDAAQSDDAAATDPDERLEAVVSSDEDAEDAGDGGTSIAERAAQAVQNSQGQDRPSESDAPGAGSAAAGSVTPPESAAAPTDQPAGDASLADAQQSLLNAIVRHARAAAEADPRTARDHLEAANEAAEALAEISPEN